MLSRKPYKTYGKAVRGKNKKPCKERVLTDGGRLFSFFPSLLFEKNELECPLDAVRENFLNNNFPRESRKNCSSNKTFFFLLPIMLGSQGKTKKEQTWNRHNDGGVKVFLTRGRRSTIIVTFVSKLIWCQLTTYEKINVMFI